MRKLLLWDECLFNSRISFVLLALLLFWMRPAQAAISQPTRVQSGLLSGVTDQASGVTAFKGIPYAAAPVGGLRWRPPQPPVRWKGVHKADSFAASCVQKQIVGPQGPYTHEFVSDPPFSEDCLYLNVWTPAKSTHEHRAVMVWIYGGAFLAGSGEVPIYDGAALAKKGIVVVSFNYRLGIFGFFAHPELTKESPHRSSGNYGLLDQVAALRWVQRNIGAFGGDPRKITIAGQSAGAASVHYLVSSPLAKGLFAGAIAESCPSGCFMLTALNQAEKEGVAFAAAKGTPSLADLRAMTAVELTAAPVQPHKFRFSAIIDGWFLPRSEAATIAAGKQNDVPMLTGLNRDEIIVNPGYRQLSAQAFRERLREDFGPLADDALKLYPANSDDQAAASEKALNLDEGLAFVYLWGISRAKTGRTALYTYYWDHPEPGPNESRYGAFHSSEIPYVFETLDKSNRPWTAEDRRISDRMSSYWVSFVKTGDPNGAGLPHWPPFREHEPLTMELGDTFGPRPLLNKSKLELLVNYLAAHPHE